MCEVVGTFFGAETWQERADDPLETWDGSFGRLAYQRLEFAERQFDRIEVGRIFGQIAQARLLGFDHLTDGGSLVDCDIVHDDDIAAPERRSQALLDIGQEYLGVHGAFDNHRGDHFVATQPRHKGDGLPLSERSTPDQLNPAATAAPKPNHLGGDRRLVDEDQSGGIEQTLLANPTPPRAGHVRPLLFGRAETLFF